MKYAYHHDGIKFQPAIGLNKGWLQTLAGYYLPNMTKISNHIVHKIQLPDRDTLVLIENRPPAWKPGDRIILLVHGLTGSHESKYMVRIAMKLLNNNYHLFRLNFRNCGPGVGLARYPHHSGRSKDLYQVLQWIAARYPATPITQMGFSMGGNTTLKMVGEYDKTATGNLDSVIAVSPPIDLSLTVDHMSKHGVLFERHFVKQLCKGVQMLQKLDPSLPKCLLSKNLSLREFDDVYTAPQNGFLNVADYYQRASAKPLLRNIKINTLILAAKDDPIVATSALEHVEVNANITIKITPSGGHLGYISNYCSEYGMRWMDYYLLNWLAYLTTN
jgi:predicted alpha/beta-fold hydrolase